MDVKIKVKGLLLVAALLTLAGCASLVGFNPPAEPRHYPPATNTVEVGR